MMNGTPTTQLRRGIVMGEHVMAGSDITDRARGLAEAVYRKAVLSLGMDYFCELATPTLASALQRERDEALREAARKHCERCAEDCEDGIQCADGHLCEEQLAVFGPERAAILADQPKEE
jgi:hypothetical protein